MRSNQLGPEGILALANAPELDALEILYVGNNVSGPEQHEALQTQLQGARHALAIRW